jgi:hypothetical protein
LVRNSRLLVSTGESRIAMRSSSLEKLPCAGAKVNRPPWRQNFSQLKGGIDSGSPGRENVLLVHTAYYDRDHGR